MGIWKYFQSYPGISVSPQFTIITWFWLNQCKRSIKNLLGIYLRIYCTKFQSFQLAKSYAFLQFYGFAIPKDSFLGCWSLVRSALWAKAKGLTALLAWADHVFPVARARRAKTSSSVVRGQPGSIGSTFGFAGLSRKTSLHPMERFIHGCYWVAIKFYFKPNLIHKLR